MNLREEPQASLFLIIACEDGQTAVEPGLESTLDQTGSVGAHTWIALSSPERYLRIFSDFK